jgi:hypothetical protein
MWREGKKRCFCSEEKKKKHSNWTTGKKTLDNLATPKDPAFSVATSPNDDKNSSTEDGANIDGDNDKKYEKISSAKKSIVIRVEMIFFKIWQLQKERCQQGWRG